MVRRSREHNRGTTGPGPRPLGHQPTQAIKRPGNPAGPFLCLRRFAGGLRTRVVLDSHQLPQTVGKQPARATGSKSVTTSNVGYARFRRCHRYSSNAHVLDPPVAEAGMTRLQPDISRPHDWTHHVNDVLRQLLLDSQPPRASNCTIRGSLDNPITPSSGVYLISTVPR